MAQDVSIPIAETLRKCFPAELLHAWAHETGFVQRRRKVDPVTFFWALVFGFATGRERTLAGLRRSYHRVADEIAPSSFYKRFNTSLAAFFQRAVCYALEHLGLDHGPALQGHFASFRDLMLVDSSLIQVHDLLQGVFRGTRKTAPATAKAQVVLSVRGAGRSSIQFTGERTNDGRTLVIGPWVEQKLLVFDLGFFVYPLFHAITENHGFFVSRVKRHINLQIDAVRTPAHASSVGQRLRDAIQTWTEPVVDLDVRVPIHRTKYGRYSERMTRPYRVVAVRHPESGAYHLYMTNVPTARLAADAVPAVYAARWHIELLFKEWKSHYHLTDLPSSKRAIVETLLHATVLTLIVSRRLASELRRRVATAARRVRPQRWAALIESLAADLLWVVVRRDQESRAVELALRRALLAEAIDPNLRRQGLLEAVQWRLYQPAQPA
jgi:putative transposase